MPSKIKTQILRSGGLYGFHKEIQKSKTCQEEIHFFFFKNPIILRKNMNIQKHPKRHIFFKLKFLENQKNIPKIQQFSDLLNIFHNSKICPKCQRIKKNPSNFLKIQRQKFRESKIFPNSGCQKYFYKLWTNTVGHILQKYNEEKRCVFLVTDGRGKQELVVNFKLDES